MFQKRCGSCDLNKIGFRCRFQDCSFDEFKRAVDASDRSGAGNGWLIIDDSAGRRDTDADNREQRNTREGNYSLFVV